MKSPHARFTQQQLAHTSTTRGKTANRRQQDQDLQSSASQISGPTPISGTGFGAKEFEMVRSWFSILLSLDPSLVSCYLTLC
jgi:hypothetical protein